jgi:hypothetical protein
VCARTHTHSEGRRVTDTCGCAEGAQVREAADLAKMIASNMFAQHPRVGHVPRFALACRHEIHFHGDLESLCLRKTWGNGSE